MIKISLSDKGKKPTMIMLMGLPGSGKSTIAQEICCRKNSMPVIHSSDALREELYGDINDTEHTEEVFKELTKRIKQDLSDGKDVIFDATNISKKKRRHFLTSLNKIDHYNVCFCMMLPYESCLERNKNRDRVVPEEVIKRMYMNWCPPDYEEGFDLINFYVQYDSKEQEESYILKNFFFGKINACSIPQENSHHSLTIGDHCWKCADYIQRNYWDVDDADTYVQLFLAGVMHDIGKPFTKTIYNSKGEIDGECHYYQHHCVGAYESIFYLDVLGAPLDFEIIISNLIYYHMMPFISWEKSKSAERRHKIMIGEKMYQMVMMLHEADKAAH